MTQPSKIVGLSKNELNQLRTMIGKNYTVLIFGSRVTGKHKKFSDVDLCLKSDRKIPDSEIAELKFRFQESNFPYKIDLVDFADLSDDFKSLVLSSAVELSH